MTLQEISQMCAVKIQTLFTRRQRLKLKDGDPLPPKMLSPAMEKRYPKKYSEHDAPRDENLLKLKLGTWELEQLRAQKEERRRQATGAR